MASTVWRGYISFGLISIPVRLFRAARAERISLRRLHREPAGVQERSSAYSEEIDRPSPVFARGPQSLSSQAALRSVTAPSAAPAEQAQAASVLTPVKQVSVRKGTDEVVAPTSVVKGYEYEKDRFVALDPEELKSAAPQTSAAMEIEEFVELVAIDPVYFETSYYVTPEEAGEKAYALLYRAFQTTGLVAIAKFAMHGREHVVVLRPGKMGVLAHTMFFASEVRAEEEFHADISEVRPKELELAETLVRSLEAPFDPEKYHDTYREKIQAIIDSKVKGQPLAVEPAVPRQAEVVDIADALRRSLANLKKPASSVQPASERESAGGGAKPAPRTRKAARGH